MEIKKLFVLLLGFIALSGFAAESDGICSFRIGQFEIHMLVERENPGNAGILVGANEAFLRQYIPADGFTHSTNTFLIKAPGQNILVDTGFGQAVIEKIRMLGVTPAQVDAVLLTHLHGDHIGGLQRDGQAVFPNAKIYLSARELEHFTKTQVNQGAVAALAPYGNNVVTFDPAALNSVLRELIPGIFPIANYGHTPGHTVFLVQSGNGRLIIGGDFLHVALVQFANPDMSATYDMDQREAALSRRQILDFAAQNRIPIGGMHIVFPGFGLIEKQGNGFVFLPR